MRRTQAAILSKLKDLPDAYDEAEYEVAINAVYASYGGDGKSKYVEGEAIWRSAS